MKRLILLLITVVSTLSIVAQNIDMPTTAQSNCGGTFRDNGGAGNYTNNQNRTFTLCPSTPGSKVSVTFTSFNLENNFDFLRIYNGTGTGALLETMTGSTIADGAAVTLPFTIQSTSADGCLTFNFTSDGITTAAGWVATIGCTVPCQTITANFISSTPAPIASGVIKACQNQPVTFVGSGTFSNSGTGATYVWSFGDGTTATGTSVTKTYTTAGAYRVNLTITDPSGCKNANFLNRIVHVATTPTMTTSAAPAGPICPNTTTTLTGSATAVPFVGNCTPTSSGTTFLPDGNGVSYETPISVDCYGPGETITAASQFTNVCLNMEHSFSGDLSIDFICPDGKTMRLKPNQGAGALCGNCGYDFGIPVTTGTNPGTGKTYCFTPTATQPINTGPVTGTSLNAGDYMPTQPFTNLIGCPINGQWKIRVTDNISQDNGYIFFWDFNLSAPPVDLSFTPTLTTTWTPNPELSGITATQATATPTTSGSKCYDFVVTDNHGCTYTRPQCITVSPGTTPTFAAVGPFCSGAVIPALPTSSTNATPISGSWSPAINNTATTTYTFTPTSPGAQCAIPTTMTITITPGVTPTFNAVGPFCSGAAIAALPTSSTNTPTAINGAWTPAINNTATTTYTFTPTAGQCANTVNMTITITPNTTPTFNNPGPICSGATLAAFPTSSTNATPVFGTWAPAPNNATTTTYTFTPSPGQCAVSMTMTVVVNTTLTPDFANVGPFCSGDPAATMFTNTSPNGVTGTWTPAFNNAATTIYSFAPNAGQCANSITKTITINPSVTPSFTAIGPFCSGATFGPLPTTSNNSIIGAWSPAINNTATTTYTFNPNPGQCAASVAMTVNITAPTVPSFTALGPFCQGTSFGPLPTTSNNSIAGSWGPAINTAATTNYTFTPNAGLCATTAQMNIVINPPVVPAFTTPGPFCSGATIAALPTTPNNDPTISGAWAPAINNTATTTYTYTPAAGQCATTAQMTIVVNPNVVPTFTAVPPTCEGTAIAALPTTSNNSITGSWLPTTVDNTTTTTYTFTPTAPQCATTTTLTITITPKTTPTFNPIPPLCGGATAPALQGTSNNSIVGTWVPPTVDNSTTGNYVFTPNTPQCAESVQITVNVGPPATPTFDPIVFCQGATAPPLQNPSTNGVTGTWNPAVINNSNAAQVYSFTPNAGICANTTTFTVTLTARTVPTFAAIPDFCEGTTAPTLPPGSTNSPSIFGSWMPTTISNTASGSYTFTPNGTECATTALLSVNLTPPVVPVLAPIAPFCAGATAPTLPGSSTDPFTGSWSPGVINNMATGSYTFTADAGQCATSASITVTINNPVVPTFTPVGPFCAGTAIPALPTSSTNTPTAFTGVWSPALDNTVTTTYNFVPTAGQCATTVDLTIVIDQPVVPVFAPIAPICGGDPAPVLPGSSTDPFTGTWIPATVNNMASGTYKFTPDAGQCATTTELTVVVGPPGTPTFDPISDICEGTTPIPTLEPTSIEGFAGTWNPTTIDNTISKTYTFTPNGGVCATTTTLTVTITPLDPSTFAPIPAFCEGTTAPVLPPSSNEGHQGLWTPNVIDNTAGATYTFQPSAGICATSGTLTTVVDPLVVPTFDPIADICAGAPAPGLPATSLENITGTWMAATVDNMASGTYSFTPNAGQCATSATLNVVVSGSIVPTFDPIPVLCQNSVAPPLQNPSLNGVNGTWTPATISTSAVGTLTYTFTPDPGGCEVSATIDVTVGDPVVPTFNPLSDMCEGTTPVTLPGSSTNAVPITGTWTPAVIDNMASGTYSFLPDPAFCATTAELSIVVNTLTLPTFIQIGSQCLAGSPSGLATSSNNNFTGFWSPPTIDVSSAGTSTYTFTPDPGQCASSTTMDVTVNPPPSLLSNTTVCDGTGTTYVLTVTLTGGDVATYNFDPIAPAGLNGTFAGNVWTSDPIPSGTAYSINFDDANGCGPVSVTGNKNCDCLTDAGTMNLTQLNLCENDPAVANHNGNEVLDANDVLSYVLHTNPGGTLGTVIATSATGNFTFSNPPMTLGTKYYISAVAGNDNGSGIVDVNDPCFSIAVGTPVIWNGAPTANATNNSPVCPGETVLLSTPKIVGATYQWSGPNGFNATTEDASIPNITVAEIGTYTVEVTLNGCTSLPATTDVVLNTIPTATASSNSPLCEGDDLQLNATSVAGATYSWTGPNGYTSTNQNPLVPNVTAAMAGSYDVEVTLNGCTSNPSSTNVVVNPIPVVSVPSVSTCINVPVDLHAFGATTYVWSPGTNLGGTTGATVTHNGSGPNTYTVIGTSNGCASAPVTVNVTISTSLTISVVPASATICEGSSVVLTATGGTNYDWTVNPTGLNPTNAATVTANPGTTQTYTVTGETSGCTGNTTVTVTVTPATVPTFTALTAVCRGGTAPTLPTTSNNGITGTWSSAPSTATAGTFNFTFTPSTGQCATTAGISFVVNAPVTPTFNPMPSVCVGTPVANLPANSNNGIPGGWSPAIVTSAPGTFNYVFTPSPGQCATTAGNTLIVNPNPTPTVASVTTCANSPITLCANGSGGTFAWSPAGSLSSSSGACVTSTVSSNTTYTIVETLNGCTGSTTATVTIAAGLTITVTPSSATICNGESVTLTANGGPAGATNYTWSPSTGLNVSNQQSVIANPTTTQTYTVNGDASGCVGQTTVTVTVNQKVNPVFNTLTAVCQGATAPTLNGTSNNGIAGSWSPSNFSTTTAGTFTSTFTPNTGLCANTTSLSLTVNAPVTPTFTQINNLCVGSAPSSNLVSNSTNGYIGSWSPSSITNNSVGVKTYSFTPVANQCATSTTMTVEVYALPTISAGSDVSNCVGVQVTLNGFCSTSPATFAWDNGVTNGVAFTPALGSTVYTLTVTDQTTSCVNTDQVTVTANPGPTVTAPGDFTICSGAEATLAGPLVTGMTYTWSNGVQDNVAFTPTATRTYTMTGTDANGCTGTDNVTVTLEALPVPTFTSDITKGCTPLSVVFTNTTPPPTGTVTWSFGDGSTTTNINATTTHIYNGAGVFDVTLTVESLTGCEGSTTIQDMIETQADPVASFSMNPKELYLLDTRAIFNNTTTGAITYAWDFGDGETSTGITPAHTFPTDSAGKYTITLTATSTLGCTDVATLNIKVREEELYFIPNTFTPDGNEVNNTFQPIFTSGFDPFDFKMTIFNRWGETIFETRNAKLGWDGTYKGKVVEQGTFAYVIEFLSSETDERVKISGHVNLMK